MTETMETAPLTDAELTAYVAMAAAFESKTPALSQMVSRLIADLRAARAEIARLEDALAYYAVP